MPDLRTTYILDDEPAIGAVVCRVVQSCGHLATAFENPSEFLSKVESDPPNLIILDLALGRSDAVEVIRKLESLNYQGDVILMSGRSGDILAEINRIGIAHGLSMLPPLNKPFRGTELQARLKSVPEKQSSGSSSQLPARQVDLGEALQKNWVELWYQPKIDLRTLSVCGAEALVRINHPEFGIISPGEFLPPSGDPLYGPLSRLVIATATSDWKKLAAQNVATKIAINVPASVLMTPDFVSNIREHLPQDSSFPGLVVEVTEDEVVRDVKTIHEVALQLKLSSVELSIDDFGTAHASLARLRDLPCTELKLDKSFVANCSSDEGKRKICQTVRDLAKRFNLTTCAEGVETAEDLKILTSMGFDAAQGYLFARPMTLASFTAMMLSEGLRTLKGELAPALAPAPMDVYPPAAVAAYGKTAKTRQEIEALPLNFFFGGR
jgi:EAL domain-containing protein (putative c-di-GMP-specific phosphodiesterase class I)/CheY-like chemotaxis protein